MIILIKLKLNNYTNFFKKISTGYNVKDIVCIGITNQRETTVVWDKLTGEPLYNAIGNYEQFCAKKFQLFNLII